MDPQQPFLGVDWASVTNSSVPPLLLILFYLVGCMLTITNYVAFVRHRVDEFGQDLKNAYFAFTIISNIVFFVVAAVSWLWAARYVNTTHDRRVRISIGIFAIFLAHDLPLFIMELDMALDEGFIHGVQGVVFFYQLLEFLVSFVFGWLNYTYYAAGLAHTHFADPAEGELKTGTEQLNILPPAGPAPVPGQGVDPRTSPLLHLPSSPPQPPLAEGGQSSWGPRPRRGSQPHGVHPVPMDGLASPAHSPTRWSPAGTPLAGGTARSFEGPRTVDRRVLI